MLTVYFRHYLFTMVFSKEDKFIIQNDYEEKGWCAHKIWKDHSSKNWTYTSVKKLLKCFKDNGTLKDVSFKDVGTLFIGVEFK